MGLAETTPELSAQPVLSPRTGGRILVDQILINRVDTVFCVPGESYLSVLDALYDHRDRIKLVNARHEAAASQMAEARGKLTGRPGICLVTRGPGACHAAVGVHTAFQDSTPMILFVGQVGRPSLQREAFQEIDYRQMFASVAKWVGHIDMTSRIPEYVARAFQTATSGRPGPVVLSLPEDMLQEEVTISDGEYASGAQSAPSSRQIQDVIESMSSAHRPLVILGGSTWTDAACRQVQQFAERACLPVATSFRRQDLFRSDSDSFVGDIGMSGPPSLIARCHDADLLLVIGSRLGEFVTQGYTLLRAPSPVQPLIHVYPDPNVLGSVFQPTIGIASSTASFVETLHRVELPTAAGWSQWTRDARADFLSWRSRRHFNGHMNPAEIMWQLQELLPADAIVTLDAGNHAGWPQRYLHFGRPARQLGPTNGSMGYSLPAGIAASLAYPSRQVVSFVGDGGFMMTCQELATARHYGAKPIIVLFNNSMYGTIRMHQERHYPGRVIGTDLVNPDFIALARAMGAHGERVHRTDEFKTAFLTCVESGVVAVIELCIDQELISTKESLSSLRLHCKDESST